MEERTYNIFYYSWYLILKIIVTEKSEQTACCVLNFLGANVVVYENLHLVLLCPRILNLSPLCSKDYLESVLCFCLEIQLSLEERDTPGPLLSLGVATIPDDRGQSGHTDSFETS